MKNIKNILKSVSAILLASFTSCKVSECGNYSNLQHIGIQAVSFTSVISDTLRLDAGNTSLEGQWHMRDSLIYFVDKYVVGVKIYSAEGQYEGSRIIQGRGPDEMLSTAWCSAIDQYNQTFVFQDKNCALQIYSSDGEHKILDTRSAWFTQLGDNFGEYEWWKLKQKPDPEIPQMYEYRYECDRMHSYKSSIILPITTEHIDYNGFEKSARASEYWRDSYIFITFNAEDIADTKHLFGHYPPVYHKKNIPAFSEYDFCFLDNERLLVSFAADPDMYIMKLDGTVENSDGFADKNISCDYPQTRTFKEYEENVSAHREKYGYYGRLSHCGGFIFRTCRCDSGIWKLQVYDESTFDMVGNIELGIKPLEIIGFYDDYFYAYYDIDLHTEEFILLRFQLSKS